MTDESIITDDVLAAMGIDHNVVEAVTNIVGRRPNVDELSTLLAMWDANGRQQSLLGWLRGQRHSDVYNDYLYDGVNQAHKDIKEPRVRECIEIAKKLSERSVSNGSYFMTQGDLLYMVGHVSSEILGSDYARQCLHIAELPVEMGDDDEQQAYLSMILDALVSKELVHSMISVGTGGLFGTLALLCGNATGRICGFDILTCREVRLDAFLFGEEPGRFVVSLSESQDDVFLQKLDEAGVNCCFLGRATKGRVLVDGMDFGDIALYVNPLSHCAEK
ncbi:MAG: hypothetical protein IJ764_03180 [Bacteroidales bacterium]|nr:hypothetical protein [Bacteroidales bacterium]